MKHKEFRKKVILNLEEYKLKKLKIKDNGVYKYGGKEIKQGYILPKNERGKNFINGEETFNYYNRKLKLHRYCNHLNSSQVMCINFFHRLVGKRVLLNILNILLSTNLKGNYTYDFEYVDSEKKGEGTNFNFFISVSTGEKIYFEVKYTENKFGKVTRKNSVYHIKKFNKVYKKLIKNSLYIDDNIDINEFFNHYKIYRNIAYITNSKEFMIFIYPFDNEALDKEIKAILHEKKFSNVYILDWKELYKVTLEEIKTNADMIKYYGEFYEKYLNY